MDESDRTREQLLEELRTLRARLAECEQARALPATPRETGLPIRPVWLDQLLQTIPDAFVVLDRHWRLIHLHRAPLSVAPESATGLLGRCLWEVCPELLGTPTETQFRRAVAEQTPVQFEERRPLDGHLLEVHARPYADGLLVYWRDVSQRQQSEELNQRVVEALAGGLVTIAPDGLLLAANAEARRILGLSADDLGRRHVRDFEAVTLWEDGSPCPVEDYPVSRCLQTGQPQPATTIGLRGANGQITWGVFTAVPLRDRSPGPVTGVVVTFFDVTERRRVEEALRDREARLRVLVEQMPAILWATDHDLRITSSVGAGLAWQGLRPGEQVGRTLAECLGTDDEDFLPLAAHHRALHGQSQSYEMDWHGRSYQTHIEPLRNEAGRVVGCVGACLDITERKRAERQLQEYARSLLEVQERERRRLACELHDEVGQALTGLRLLLEAARRSAPDQQQDSLGQAQRLVKELTGEVRDLSLRLRPSMLDDLGLPPALQWHVERYCAQTGVQVSLEQRGLDRRLPPEVETAAYRIVQEALANVARHAGVAACTVRVWLSEGRLHLQVEDAGRGFDEAVAQRRGPSTGLSGMRERAVLLGGCLRVESALGRGTRLAVELPVGCGTAEAVETEDRPGQTAISQHEGDR